MENKISNKCAECDAENMVDVVIRAVHISHECKRITFDDMKRILNETD